MGASMAGTVAGGAADASLGVAPTGRPAGRGRRYVVTVKRLGDPGEHVVDLDAEDTVGDAEHVADLLGIRKPGRGPDREVSIEDDARVADLLVRRRVAASEVDYHSFRGDGAYLDAFDARVEDQSTSRVRRAGEVARYKVLVNYDDGGAWCDHVEATDPEDASFQARWICAENLGADPEDGLEGFVASMDLVVLGVEPEPVLPRELADAVIDLETARLAGEPLEDRVAALVRMAAHLTDRRPAPPARPN